MCVKNHQKRWFLTHNDSKRLLDVQMFLLRLEGLRLGSATGTGLGRQTGTAGAADGDGWGRWLDGVGGGGVGVAGGTRERGRRDRSEKKEISVQPMTGLHRLLRAQGGETTFARSGGPDVTGARPGQTLRPG